MTTYFVYENWVRKKAVVHEAECGACKNGKGMHTFRASGKNDNWHGPISAFSEAVNVAKGTGQPLKLCGLCKPG